MLKKVRGWNLCLKKRKFDAPDAENCDSYESGSGETSRAETTSDVSKDRSTLSEGDCSSNLDH